MKQRTSCPQMVLSPMQISQVASKKIVGVDGIFSPSIPGQSWVEELGEVLLSVLLVKCPEFLGAVTVDMVDELCSTIGRKV